MRGFTRGALGLGVIIDGVTLYYSLKDFAEGNSTKFSEALRNLADMKEEELGRIMSQIDLTNLLIDPTFD